MLLCCCDVYACQLIVHIYLMLMIILNLLEVGDQICHKLF